MRDRGGIATPANRAISTDFSRFNKQLIEKLRKKIDFLSNLCYNKDTITKKIPNAARTGEGKHSTRLCDAGPQAFAQILIYGKEGENQKTLNFH